MDVRSVRYPGLIGNKSEPVGGTTDYAVDMLRSAVREEAFTSPLKPDSIDDSDARRDWKWKPDFDLATMVREMLKA